jgi:hypothetical protein
VNTFQDMFVFEGFLTVAGKIFVARSTGLDLSQVLSISENLFLKKAQFDGRNLREYFMAG